MDGEDDVGVAGVDGEQHGMTRRKFAGGDGAHAPDLRAGAARRFRRCLRTRRTLSSFGSRARMRAPSPCARASHASRMARNPAPSRCHTISRSRAARTVSASSRRMAPSAPSAASDVAGNSVSSGWMREIDADADGEPVASASAAFQQDARDLPAVGQHVVRPFHARCAHGARSAPPCRRPRCAATKESCAHSAARRPGRSNSVAARLPCGVSQSRPRRPRPAVWRPAVIQSGPRFARQRQAARFFVGGIDFVERLRRSPPASRVHGNSALAAASAAEITGDAATMKNSVKAAGDHQDGLGAQRHARRRRPAPARRNTSS